jgi:hypothetical protein
MAGYSHSQVTPEDLRRELRRLGFAMVDDTGRIGESWVHPDNDAAPGVLIPRESDSGLYGYRDLIEGALGKLSSFRGVPVAQIKDALTGVDDEDNGRCGAPYPSPTDSSDHPSCDLPAGHSGPHSVAAGSIQTPARSSEPHPLQTGTTQWPLPQEDVAALQRRVAVLEALLGKTLAFLPRAAEGVPPGSGLRDRVLEALGETSESELEHDASSAGGDYTSARGSLET